MPSLFPVVDFLGSRGLSVHCTRVHPGLLALQRRPDFIIRGLLSPSTNADSWVAALVWLHSIPPRPPTFRVSLYYKLSGSLKSDFVDCLLRVLRAIHLATMMATEGEPIHEVTVDPLIRLFLLAEALILCPARPASLNSTRIWFLFDCLGFVLLTFSLYTNKLSPPSPMSVYMGQLAT